MTRARCGAAVLALFIGSMARADDKKTFDKAVSDSLREIHHVGRELYNANKDFTGTYRVYQGALLAVKPLLAYRPEVQKELDAALAAAEKEAEPARRAFMLHEAIEKTRAALKVPLPEAKTAELKKEPEPPAKKAEEVKKPEPPMKKPEETKPADPPKKVEVPAKKPEVVAPPKPKEGAKAAGGPGFRGVVTLMGKPLAGGEVTFVSLDLPKPRVFSATTQADGQYAPAEVMPAGTYAVIVTGKGVPAKYTTTTTSALRATVGQPPTVFNIDLQ